MTKSFMQMVEEARAEVDGVGPDETQKRLARMFRPPASHPAVSTFPSACSRSGRIRNCLKSGATLGFKIALAS